MRVVVDSKIPYIRAALDAITAFEAVYAEGVDFSSTLVRDADALIVRTRTRCDAHLLAGSRVQFIATATIGYDHIDTRYCAQAGIAWANAPGCNARSVEQYIRSVLLLLQREQGLTLAGATLGVVGVGHVGTLVAEAGRAYGMRVLACDPPRAERGEAGFVPLRTLMQQADVITFHTPLTREGRHATFHMADSAFFAGLGRKPFIINTSRGEVVDGGALLAALRAGLIRQAVVDVWEHEPDVDRALLEAVYLGTPHIAGYSADGKATASRMALDALCAHFHVAAHYTITPPSAPVAIPRDANEEQARLLSYDPRIDSAALKARPDQFEQLRGNYRVRRELP